MNEPLKPALIAALLAFGSCVAASVAAADEVVVFAASSLKEALQDVAAGWNTETGNTAIVSLAGSSTLARQIQAGAPADVFVSANVAWIDVLEREGLLRPDSRRDLLTNALVVIAKDPFAPHVDFASDAGLSDRLEDDRLAMALVEAVPAGIYGKAALQSLGWWDALAPKVAQADNVRAALALVATGETPLGIVYATDAVAEPKVTLIGTFPDSSHPPIRYPAVIVNDSLSPASDAFMEYLSGPQAAAIFRHHGFGLAGQGG